MLESFRNIPLIGSWLWLIGLFILAVILLSMKNWYGPGSNPMGRTVYTGLRLGTWLTLAAIIALVLLFIPAGPWFVFALFPIAYATPPLFMLATALGLIFGVWKHRLEFIDRQLKKIIVAIAVLIVVGVAWLVAALRWIDTPI